MTKVIIEHDMHVVFSLADRITVLAGGRIIAAGRARRDQGQSEGAGSLSRRGARYEHDQTAERPPTPAPRRRAAPFFSCRDLHAYYGESYIVQGVSFRHPQGRDPGAARPQRRRQDLDAAHHRPRLDSPELQSRRDLARRRHAARQAELLQAAQAGIQLVPEDRRIIPGLTVEENLHLAQSSPAASAGRSSASTSCSRASPSGASRKASRCRAASSRCWRSPARWRATSSCCCSTSPMRASRR